MTVRISPVLWLCMALGAGGCIPKPDSTLPTTRPPIPDSPSVPDDSAFTAVSPADPGFVYYRRLYDVVFLDNATDAQVLAFFAKYQASIVGGAPLVDIYTVQVPDPGANFQAVDSLVNAMDGEPGVEVAAPIARTSPKGPLHGRYPNGERHH